MIDNEKIEAVRRKLFSLRYVSLFDIYFSNYLGYDLFVQVARCKKKDSVRVSFIDFNGSGEVVKLYYSDDVCRNIIKTIKGQICDKSYIDGRIKHDNVYINSYINSQYFEFSRYIPNDLMFLEDFFFLIFELIPRCYDVIFRKMIIKENHRLSYSSYYDGLDFDLFNDDIDLIFNSDVIKKGNKLYKARKALFLERFDNKYYAVYDDDVIVRVRYDKLEGKLYFGCSCDDNLCGYVYATLKFISNKIIFSKFYKIIDISSTHNLLDILERGEYCLCIGVRDGNYRVIDSKGDIYNLPILVDGKSQFAILEDEDGKLKDAVDDYLNSLD